MSNEVFTTARRMSIHLLLCLVAVLSFSSCAVILAPNAKEAPNLDAIRVGATRVAIENELGAPIEDSKASLRSGAARTCLYHYFVRNPRKGDRSWGDKVEDTLLGFQRKEVLVYYDRGGRAIRINYPTQRAQLLRP